MIVYPTIELQNGKCVSLKRGRLEEAAIWHVDPIETVRGFAESGATWMQVTDFNGVEGDDSNAGLIEDIIRAAGIPVQVAGGIRTAEAAERWIDKGAGRIVMGTTAVKQPDVVKQLAKLHPDQIVVAVDVWHGHVLTDGWREESMFKPSDFLESFAGTPLAAFLVTDVDADLEEIEVSASEITALAASTRIPVIASGVVRGIDDISLLKYAGTTSGVVIGRALFDKSIELTEALAVASPQVEQTATFV